MRYCCRHGAAQQIVEKSCKILLGPGVAYHSAYLAGGDFETRDQGLRAVAAEGLRGPGGAIAALAGHSEVAATSAVSFPLLSLMSPYEAPAAA
jgi:hypothetical protein